MSWTSNNRNSALYNGFWKQISVQAWNADWSELFSNDWEQINKMTIV